MTLIVLAEFEFKHLVYLFFFVLWIVGQIFESNKKKKRKTEQAEAERSGRPPPEQTEQPSSSPLDGDLKKLLEQLTGQPSTAEERPKPPPPPRVVAPPPPLPSNATIEQVRAQSQRLKANLKKAQAARPAAQPYRRETYEVATAVPTAPPAPVAAASISVAFKDLNIRDRHMHTPPLRTAPSSPMRATADAQRLAWIKNPATLRQLMTARFVLDPPKALEN